MNMRCQIYVASSWRNEYYPEVVTNLREAGHKVHDSRNLSSGGIGMANGVLASIISNQML